MEPRRLPSRRQVAAGGALALVGGFAFSARGESQARLNEAHLRSIVAFALTGQRLYNFRNDAGRALGFTVPLKYKNAFVDRGDIRFGLAVLLPEQENGLVFYELRRPSGLFKVHRTGFHLRRLASARNNPAKEWLPWVGAECDADYAAQLAIWASQKLPESQRR